MDISSTKLSRGKRVYVKTCSWPFQIDCINLALWTQKKYLFCKQLDISSSVSGLPPPGSKLGGVGAGPSSAGAPPSTVSKSAKSPQGDSSGAAAPPPLPYPTNGMMTPPALMVGPSGVPLVANGPAAGGGGPGGSAPKTSR